MRIVPIVTAIVVTLGLYALVFERDALFAFARGESEDAASTPDVADTSSATPDEPETPEIGVVVLRSIAEQIDSAVILRGQTAAVRQVDVRAETSATVISEPLRKGSFVSMGDLLCKLDPGTREAALAEARARLSEAKSRVPESEARLTEAKARLAEARINHNAADKLSKGGFASETRLASTQAAVRSAEAGIKTSESGVETTKSGIESAAAAVAAAKREIDRLSIHAPFDGLLESDTAELGSLMQPGSLCGTILQLDPIKLVGFVPETEVNRVKIGALAGSQIGQTSNLWGFVRRWPQQVFYAVVVRQAVVIIIRPTVLHQAETNGGNESTKRRKPTQTTSQGTYPTVTRHEAIESDCLLLFRITNSARCRTLL